MVNIKKLGIILVFLLNIIIFFCLKYITELNLTNYSINFDLASSYSLKTFLIVLITLGEFFLISRLTKMKYIGNLKKYQIKKEYISIGPFLLQLSHHPSCSCYSDHELVINNHRLCSGCYGSSIGIFLGFVILSTTYIYIFPFDFYFYSGFFLIQLGLLKSFFKRYQRLILNAFFPLGVNLLLISTLTLQYGVVYAIIFIPFLLLEFALRLFTPSLDVLPKICPEGIAH